YLSFGVGYYDDKEENSTGKLTARLATEAGGISKVVGTFLIQVVAQFLQARSVWGSAFRTKRAYERSGQAGAKSIRSIRTVATLRDKETFIKSFNEHNSEPHSGNLKGAITTSIGFGFSQVCILLVNALLFYSF
ncbi:hypothetical protein GGI19_006731, partial [Coemansia pectinata]